MKQSKFEIDQDKSTGFKTDVIIFRRLVTRGWIPTVLIAKIGSIEAEPFYAGPMSRVDAGDLLIRTNAENEQLDQYNQGNFVLRKNLKTQNYRLE